MQRMSQDPWDRLRIFFTRLKIEFPALATFPRFRTTLAVLGLLGVYGLLHGHVVIRSTDGQSLSLAISLASWLGTTFIVLLRNPITRLKVLILQLVSIILVAGFVVALLVAYTMWFSVSHSPDSLRIAWLGATALLAYLAFQTLFRAFIAVDYRESGYPGRRTAPFFFFLAICNALWWYWPFFSQLFR